MAHQPDSNLLEQAEVIRDETTANANTATRVGEMLVDIVDSKYNRPYQVYTATLSQTSTNAPVATILENDFTATTFTFYYEGVGLYSLNTNGNGIFTANKTVCFTNQISDDNVSTYGFTAYRSEEFSIIITSSGVDNLLGQGNIACLEIRVYN